ncbi:Porin O precursor [Anatilimnocola aggregata]|uniref:Porin O n=1 Tax=Anatilimnocola aggregata TaxID=2528021 RepID=A0A517Y514_9BACT|nr:porin [Anatilimnocola aggregata]QDU25212.1 Porin O precursor [Anatilimnocola aggregata]
MPRTTYHLTAWPLTVAALLTVPWPGQAQSPPASAAWPVPAMQMPVPPGSQIQPFPIAEQYGPLNVVQPQQLPVPQHLPSPQFAPQQLPLAPQPYYVQPATATEADEALVPLPLTDAERLADLEAKFDDIAQKLKASVEKEKPAPKKEDFPTFRTTGFLQLDSALYAQTPENIATVGDAQDGTGFRRARLAVQGKVAEFTAYQIEMDFATAGRPSFFDCYVEQSNIPFLGAVRIGHFCQPFSVDSLTGFRNLTFLERSLPFLALVPFRKTGISAANQSEDQMTQWTYSLYRTGGFNNAPLGDTRSATDIGDIGGYSFATRATHLLHYDDLVPDRYLWHIGGGYTFAMLGANDAVGSGASGNIGSPRPFYQARTTPEFGPLGFSEFPSSFGSAVNGTPIFVDTGRYEATNFNMFGLESVTQWGPWGVTAEYIGTQVNTPWGSVYYQGGYAQAAYRLTGENRVYDKKTGTLGKLVPYTDFIPLKRDGICGWGAWEVAARWSVIDLRNPDSFDGHYYVAATNSYTGTSKAGNGVLNDTTHGITWFLNTHTKIQANWIHAMLDNTAGGPSTADLFVSRVQVDY